MDVTVEITHVLKRIIYWLSGFSFIFIYFYFIVFLMNEAATVGDKGIYFLFLFYLERISQNFIFNFEVVHLNS